MARDPINHGRIPKMFRVSDDEMIDTLVDYTVHRASIDEILAFACDHLIDKFSRYTTEELIKEYNSLVVDYDD